MKIDPQSVYVGMGVVGVVAGGLGIWRRRLSRIFAVCLASFLVFELFCSLFGPEFLVPVWWAVHMPSAIALGADEILERHGVFVSTAFHVGDFFLWSALVTGVFWFRDSRRRHEDIVVAFTEWRHSDAVWRFRGHGWAAVGELGVSLKSMTSLQRQIVWFAYVLFLLMATLGVLASVRDVAAVSALTVGVVLSPLILIYAWARFCVWIWKPLYRQEVSPGWCLVLLFAFFSVVFLVQVSHFLVQYLFAQ